MLAYQSNIINKVSNPVVNDRSVSMATPNKRGCCQTKRRNYNLLATSNGIDAPSNKSCCSQPNKSPEETINKSSCSSSSCSSGNKSSCSSCSSGDKSGCSSCSSKSKHTKDSFSKDTNITSADVKNARKKVQELVSSGLIKKNEYLEIFDSDSNRQVTPYSNEQIKAKLETPELQLDVVTNLDTTKNSINISIIDVGKKRKYLDQTFRFKDNETNIEKYEESVAVHTFARWISLQNIYKGKKSNKKSNEIQEHEPKKISRKDCKESYGIDSECMCINHDMGCTAEPIITMGGKLKLWFMCAGFFEVDVYECCYHHDTAMWCSSGLEASALLGVRLITCFEEKIIDKYLEESSPLCAFFGLPLLISSIIVSLPIILSPFIGAGMHFTTGSEYRNKDNSHSDSCLCGGDLPTVCCGGYDGACRDECCNKIDLCSHKVDKTRGQGCVDKPKCEKKCTYYVSPNSYNPNRGTLTSYKLWTDEKGYYTEENPNKILKKSDCCTVSLPEKCTDKCFNCFYACKLNPNGKGMSWNNGRVLIDSSHLGAAMRGVPCCEGTPNEDLNSKSNYCSKDYGRGGGGIPDCGSPKHKRLGGPCNEVDRENKSNTNILLLGI